MDWRKPIREARSGGLFFRQVRPQPHGRQRGHFVRPTERFHPAGKQGYTRLMQQRPDFDIDRFEQRVDTLLSAHRQLLADYRTLQAAHQAQEARNAELRERLNSVIERIRALEAEADSV